MLKYPSDVSVSKNCIDANMEMVKRHDPDNFHCSPPQERCLWTIPKIAFNIAIKCETAIKTNGPLYKHVQLGVCLVEFNLPIVLMSTECPMLLQNKLVDHGHSFLYGLCYTV